MTRLRDRIALAMVVIVAMAWCAVATFKMYEQRWILFDNYGTVDSYEVIDSNTSTGWYCYYTMNEGDCKVVTIKDDEVIDVTQVN